MTRAKTKVAAIAVKVPQTRGEASAALKLIGERTRSIGRLEADMNDELAAIKETAEAKAGPLRVEAEGLIKGLQVWCEANREQILDARTKTANLGTGTVSWRLRPPSVSVRGVEAVIEACRRLGLTRFIRTKEELNKEALLAEPAVARGIAGVSIGTAGEQFIVEPFEAELEGAQ